MNTPRPQCDCGAQIGEDHEPGCPARVGDNCPNCFVAKGKPHRPGCPLAAIPNSVAMTADGNIVTAITAARGSVYGPFICNAIVGQAIRDAMRSIPGALDRRWNDLPIDVREGLDYLAGKISRIVTGDPEYLDNWDDIGGFAKIVADRIRKTKGETK